MDLDELAFQLKEKGEKYVDLDFLKKFSEENEGFLDISKQAEELKKITSIKNILNAIEQLRMDIYCLIKQEAISRDDEYKKIQKEFFNAISKPIIN